MKPFDIEKAKAGAAVVDNSGFPARILCFNADTVGSRDNKPYPIVALCGPSAIPRSFNEQGEHIHKLYTLHMQTTHKAYWINCYRKYATKHATKAAADVAASPDRIHCIEVAWEE